MATLTSLCFLILILSPHCIFVSGAKAAEGFQNKPKPESQKEEQTSPSSSSSNGRKLDESINPSLTTYPSLIPPTYPLYSPFNPTFPTPITSNSNPSSTYPNPNPIPSPLGPSIQAQTWCIARPGEPEISLQEGLDYACGIGGADCSMIQPGASCYFPNSVESHASYAFNSYFQRSPVLSSCDFGGTAVLVNTDPSIGSCIYPSSAAATTASGFLSPPSGFNTYNPTASTYPEILGPESPPTDNYVPSVSAPSEPFIQFILVVASFSTGKLILSS